MSETYSHNVSHKELDESFTLMDIFKILSKRWRLIFFSTLLSGLLIGSYLYYTKSAPVDAEFNMLPDEYTATVQVQLDPGNTGSASAILAQSGLGSLTGVTSNVGQNVILAQTLLQGITLATQVAEEVNQEKDIDPPLTPGEVRSSVSSLYDPAKPAFLSVIYTDTDADFAAYMVNVVVDNLEVRFRQLTDKKVTYKKQFIEERLAQIEQDLRQAEQELADFQEEAGIIEIDTGTTETGVGFVTDIVFSTYVPRAERQEIKTTYLKLQREQGILEKIYSTLMTQKEVARIEELDESKMFQVIEPPVRRFAGPFRTKIIILFVAVTLVLAVLAAFALDYLDRIKKDPEESKKLESIKQDFLGNKGGS
jgi:uncharacterized protein involved in exopolysaccharide biosynthesis